MLLHKLQAAALAGMILISGCNINNQRSNPNTHGSVASSIKPSPNPERVQLEPPAKRAFDHSEKVNVHYDKFEDETSIIFLTEIPISRPDRMHMIASFSYPGQKPEQPREVALLFTLTSTDLKYPVDSDCELLVLADNGRINLGNIVHGQEGERVGDFITEGFVTKVALDKFLQIIAAKKVEMHLCSSSTEFQLTYSQLEGLRDLASRMN